MKLFFVVFTLFLSFQYSICLAQGSNVVYGAGSTSGQSLTSSSPGNSIFGFQVGANLNAGSGNVLIGSQNPSNSANTANNLTSGSYNILIGPGAGSAHSTTNYSVGIGSNALLSLFGDANTAVGFEAGHSPGGAGQYNSLFGYRAGYHLTSGSNNLFIGASAGLATTTASNNVFLGYGAGILNTTATGNVFVGYNSGSINTTGSQLTFLGYGAGSTGTTDGLTNATAIGYNAQVTTSNSMVLGNGANIGIGTYSPQTPLSVASSNVTTAGLYRSISGGTITSGGAAGQIAFGVLNTTNDTEVQGPSILGSATETWTPGSAQGSALAFRTIPNTTATSLERLRIDQNGNIGIGTAAPTHLITLAAGTTTSGIGQYNTTDQTTNYERVVEQYQSNVYTIGSYAGGTGGLRSLMLGVQTTAGVTTLSSGRVFTINSSASVASGNFNFSTGTAVAGSISTFNTSVLGTTAGEQQNMVAIQGTVTQSSTAGYTALLIAPFISSAGTGNRNLIDAGVNSAASGGGTHTSYMRLTDGGNLGVGTTDVSGGWTLAGSSYKLNVGGGGIQTTAVNVQVVGSWGDYVFEKGYKLPSLADLKTYVDQNHHLPEIPSAAEIKKDGINLGEMNKVLVKKVEELTLYLIEKDNQLKESEATMASQNERIKKLEDAVNAIIKKQN